MPRELEAKVGGPGGVWYAISENILLKFNLKLLNKTKIKNKNYELYTVRHTIQMIASAADGASKFESLLVIESDVSDSELVRATVCRGSFAGVVVELMSLSTTCSTIRPIGIGRL